MTAVGTDPVTALGPAFKGAMAAVRRLRGARAPPARTSCATPSTRCCSACSAAASCPRASWRSSPTSTPASATELLDALEAHGAGRPAALRARPPRRARLAHRARRWRSSRERRAPVRAAAGAPRSPTSADEELRTARSRVLEPDARPIGSTSARPTERAAAACRAAPSSAEADPPVEVRACPCGRRARRTASRRRRRPRRTRRVAGQQDRLAERRLDRERVRQPRRRARPGSGPWSTSRARSRAGSRTAGRSAGGRGSGCSRRRRRRSGGRDRPGSFQVALAARPSEDGIGSAAAGSPPVPPEPRRRFVETSSHTSSSPTRTSVRSENCCPRGWGSRPSAHTRSDSRSPAPIGRCWTIRLVMCTSPIAPNGKLGSVISESWSGNASMCG